jgi:hypothetical protein
MRLCVCVCAEPNCSCLTRVQHLASPRLPTEPVLPDATLSEQATHLQRSTALAARRAAKQQDEAEKKREEVRKWREQKNAEKAAKAVDGRSPRATSPRHAARLRKAGQQGVQDYLKRQVGRQERAHGVPRGTWIVREPRRREVKQLPEAGPGFREVKSESKSADATETKAPDATVGKASGATEK